MNDIRVVVAVLAGVGIYWFATLVGALGWLGVVCGVLMAVFVVVVGGLGRKGNGKVE